MGVGAECWACVMHVSCAVSSRGGCAVVLLPVSVAVSSVYLWCVAPPVASRFCGDKSILRRGGFIFMDYQPPFAITKAILIPQRQSGASP